MNNPVQIFVRRPNQTLKGLNQYYIECKGEKLKFDVLCEFYGSRNIDQSIIFCNTRKNVDWIADQLLTKDFVVLSLCDDLTKDQRDGIVRKFSTGCSPILVTKDLDNLPDVSCIINYDLPLFDFERYLNRVGSLRLSLGRIVVNLVTQDDLLAMHELERYFNTRFDEMPSVMKENSRRFVF
eukprot:TRINITY_DN3956_c0_g2_i14.p2 TRINITY_DN3956_c0_g2~~TRINITY_DN3956_c0_g2_i14.p2  ORF type:complete len:181 (-),score=32.93 TRINITY_DN3956_c0_g2_i14:121-663(-)